RVDGFDHLVRVVAAGAGEDRDLVAGFFDHQLDDASALGGGEGRGLAGGAAGDEKMNAGVDLPSGETTHTRLIQGAARGKRGDEGGSAAGPTRSHDNFLPTSYFSPSTSRMVNQPRLPCTHCAAARAPCAKVARSRTVWVSVTVSLGPSKPAV